VGHVNQAVSAQDEASLLAALRLPALALLAVQEANSRWYMEHFTNYCQLKAKVRLQAAGYYTQRGSMQVLHNYHQYIMCCFTREAT